MTRTQFFQRIAAVISAVPVFARRREPNVWDSTQGQYVLGLRAELERLGHFDDLKEDWMSVEQALDRGHKLFWAWPSREQKSGDKSKLLFSVRPASIVPYIYTPKNLHTLAILPLEIARNRSQNDLPSRLLQV